MKANFKPLGLAAAVAAASAGYAGVTHAQAMNAGNDLGDMAIVPYYTVQGDFVTGVHIINTSDTTEVVKLRFRRGSDSMDALDFNLIMSPKDEWTGFIDDSSGSIVVKTEDTTCTAPLTGTAFLPAVGEFPMPAIYATGAEEGYIEIIGMGQPTTETGAIAVYAKHTSLGVPADCGSVESNFFRNATLAPVVGSTSKGVTSSSTSNQVVPTTFAASGLYENNYVSSDNVLKVSYFVRDAASGLEFGSSAVHLENFSGDAMMSNQEIIIQGVPDLFSFLFPDMDGGSPADTGRGLFEAVRATLGVDSVINDWSVAAARNVATDWVITLPGQYAMLDVGTYTASLIAPTTLCLSVEAAAALTTPIVPCDFRDLPVDVAIETWDREEQTFTSPDGGLVISPAVGLTPAGTILENEVNVIEWTEGTVIPVLDSVYAQTFNVSALGSEFGWAELSVSADSTKTQGVFNYLDPNTPYTTLTNVPVPIIGFVAWERSFPADPSANYGRIIDHSYDVGS